MLSSHGIRRVCISMDPLSVKRLALSGSVPYAGVPERPERGAGIEPASQGFGQFQLRLDECVCKKSLEQYSELEHKGCSLPLPNLGYPFIKSSHARFIPATLRGVVVRTMTAYGEGGRIRTCTLRELIHHLDSELML